MIGTSRKSTSGVAHLTSADALSLVTFLAVGRDRPRILDGRYHHEFHLFLTKEGAQEHAELQWAILQQVHQLHAIPR
jgi:hypothetical protein